MLSFNKTASGCSSDADLQREALGTTYLMPNFNKTSPGCPSEAELQRDALGTIPFNAEIQQDALGFTVRCRTSTRRPRNYSVPACCGMREMLAVAADELGELITLDAVDHLHGRSNHAG